MCILLAEPLFIGLIIDILIHETGSAPECGDDPDCFTRMIMDEVHISVSRISDFAALADIINQGKRVRLKNQRLLQDDI